MKNININLLKNKLGGMFSSEKEKTCAHDDFWSLYKIINFSRKSRRGMCKKCGQEIQISYLGEEALRKNIWVQIFSGILWMSPAFLIIIISGLLAEIYGPWVYFLAIIDVIIFHFWAMYYIIRGGLLEITVTQK